MSYIYKLYIQAHKILNKYRNYLPYADFGAHVYLIPEEFVDDILQGEYKVARGAYENHYPDNHPEY